MDSIASTIQLTKIREWIEARQFGRLKDTLCGLDVPDLGELLGELHHEEELPIAFRLLPTERAATVLGELEPDQQEELVKTLSSEKVAAILNEMPPDDRTELLEEMPGSLAQRLLNQLRGDQRKIADSLLAYPENSIGRMMTPLYVAVRSDWTVDHVLRHIRRVAESRETFNVLYVVDSDWKLVDEIPLEEIVLADPEQIVEELMDRQFGYLNVRDDQELAIETFKKYDAVALPVVDGKGALVGIVTHDDVMDLQEEENTEDMQKMAGMAALEYSYFGSGFWRMLKSRMPWLILLLAAETGAVLVLRGFDQLLATFVIFMPLINATAGNTGSQIAGLMIRGFAVKEIDPDDWLRVLGREALRGLTMGVTLAMLAVVIVFAIGGDTGTVEARAIAVAAAMIASVTLANLLGAMLPFFFQRVGVDPAVTSGPFIACLMDISSIFIFFSIAATILAAMG